MDFIFDDSSGQDHWLYPDDDPWGHALFQEDQTPESPEDDQNEIPEWEIVTFIANTWGYFDANGNQVHDENEIFLFADEPFTVIDTDGTVIEFFGTFTVWPGS
ncbi:MAG: hypothetical protein AAFO88_06545 [Pseudomonadota bacterium]